MGASALLAWLSVAGLATAVVQVPFTRLTLNSARWRHGAPTDAWVGSYVVNVSVGTPPQELSMALSMGTDSSWVPAVKACDGGGNDYWGYRECNYGAFESASSTSWSPSDEKFQATYVDGTLAYGRASNDTLRIGGTDASNIPLGLVNSTDHWLGVLALGFNGTTFGERGATVPDRLLEQGLINSTAYSVWLDGPAASSGQLLLGAVDTSKFEAPLIRIDASRYWTGFLDFGVLLSAVNGSRSSTAAVEPLTQPRNPLYITVNPPDPLSSLPLDIAQPIWSLAGATYNESLSLALIPCAAASNLTGRVVLELGGRGGPVLDVPLRDLVLSRDEWDDTIISYGLQASADRGGPWCMFGVQSIKRRRHVMKTGGEEYYWSIGSTLLRRTYTVLDLANEEVSFGRLRTPAADEPAVIVPFPSYRSVPPSSKDAFRVPCSPSDTKEYCIIIDSGPPPANRELSLVAKVGIAVGAFVGGVVMIAVVVWYLVSQRRKRAAAGQERDGGEAAATEKRASASSQGSRPLPALPAESEGGHGPRLELQRREGSDAVDAETRVSSSSKESRPLPALPAESVGVCSPGPESRSDPEKGSIRT